MSRKKAMLIPSPGSLFMVRGVAFKRLGEETQDFRGKVGLCIRGGRMVLHDAMPGFQEFDLKRQGDAEWVRVSDCGVELEEETVIRRLVRALSRSADEELFA